MRPNPIVPNFQLPKPIYMVQRYYTLLSVMGLFVSSLIATGQPLLTETFDGGLPDGWQAIGFDEQGAEASSWDYTTIGPMGDERFREPAINSTTAMDGWVIFDSNLNCNMTGGQNAWLISPAITNSATNSVLVTFETYYRNFNDQLFLRIGADTSDLNSWQAIELFTNVDPLQTVGTPIGDPILNPQPAAIDISSAISGLDTFYVAFQYLNDSTTLEVGDQVGCSFSWQIDDVVISEITNDVRIFEPLDIFSYSTPLSIADTLDFAIRIENTGVEVVAGLDIRVEIAKDDEVVFESMQNFAFQLPAGVATDLLLIPGASFLPDETGNYVLTYELLNDDDNPINNKVVQRFEITENYLAKDNGAISFNTIGFNTTPGRIGNYYIVNETDDVRATSGLFAIANLPDNYIGQTVNLFLYEVATDNDNQFTDADVVIVGTGVYQFSQDDFPDETQNFPVLVFGADLISQENGETGVNLKANTDYILMIEYQPGMGIPFVTNPYFYTIGTLIRGNNGTWSRDPDPFFTILASLVIESNNPVSNEFYSLDPSAFNVFPTPADTKVNVNFQLPETNKLVMVTLADANGKMVKSRTWRNIKESQQEWSVEHLPSGMYWMQILTDEGMLTKRVIVKH